MQQQSNKDKSVLVSSLYGSMSFTSQVSPLLRAKFYFVSIISLMRLQLSRRATGSGWKRQAFLAILLSRAIDKDRVRDHLAGESRQVLGHLARNIFLISQRSTCHIDFVDQDMLVEIRKNGVEYRFIMSVVGNAGVPYIHDLTPLTEIFFEELYDRYDYKGGVVVDIGGYIGDTAVYFAKSGAREVYTYEPNPVNFAYLLKNIELNGMSSGTKAFEVAVSRQRRKLEVPDMAGAGTVFAHGPGLASYDVKNIDPSVVVNERGPIALLKVDCKGCELELFGAPLVQISEKVKYVIVDTGRLSSQERTAMISDLQGSGFSLDSDRDSLLYLRNLNTPNP